MTFEYMYMFNGEGQELLVKTDRGQIQKEIKEIRVEMLVEASLWPFAFGGTAF